MLSTLRTLTYTGIGLTIAAVVGLAGTIGFGAPMRWVGATLLFAVAMAASTGWVWNQVVLLTPPTPEPDKTYVSDVDPVPAPNRSADPGSTFGPGVGYTYDPDRG